MNLEDLYRLMRIAHVRAQAMVDTAPDPMLVLDQHLCVEAAKPAFLEAFRISADDTIGRHFYELGDGQWDIPELRRLLDEVIPRAAAVIDYEVQREFPSLGRRRMLLTARRMVQPDRSQPALLLSIADATERLDRTKGRIFSSASSGTG